MALVAVSAVVHIPVHVRVLKIVGVVIAMAARALEHRVVSTVNVAGGALAVGVAMGDGELGVVRMRERRAGPRAGAYAVAGSALCNREERGVRARGMSRVGGSVVVGLMAGAARVAVQVVIVVDVTVSAYPWRNGVHSDQGETCVVVIKGGVCPVDRVVAGLAGRGESSRRVRRVGGSRVVLLVARVAECAIQRVIVADVTIGAETRRHGVRVGQRETGGGVVKLAIGPQNGVVAGIASCREPGRGVGYGRGRIVVIGLVAGHASRAGQAVIVVDVAIGAQTGRRSMGSGECEPGAGMVKGRIQPVGGVVAGVASLREIRRRMVRIGGSLVILQMTAHACRSIQAVVVVDVAVGAQTGRDRVQSREGEPGVGVVKGGVQPGGGVVTGIASLREIRRDVVGIGRALEIL